MALLGQFRDDGGASCGGETADFVAGVAGGPGPVRERNRDENGLFAGYRELVALGIEGFADISTSPGGPTGLIGSLAKRKPPGA